MAFDSSSVSSVAVLERTIELLVNNCFKRIPLSGTLWGERGNCSPSDSAICNRALCFVRNSLIVADLRRSGKQEGPFSVFSRIVMQSISSGCGVENEIETYLIDHWQLNCLDLSVEEEISDHHILYSTVREHTTRDAQYIRGFLHLSYWTVLDI